LEPAFSCAYWSENLIQTWLSYVVFSERISFS
jgi:hypothetical protein